MHGERSQGENFPLVRTLAIPDLALVSSGFPDDQTARRIHAMVLARLRSKLMHADDARDVAADVMLGFAGFRGECKPETFAFSVMHRHLAEFHRRRLRRGPVIPLDDVDELADTGPDATELADLAARVRWGLEGVDEVFRPAVALRLRGLGPLQIADALAINPNTTRSRLARGMGQLKARLALREGGLAS